MKTSRMINSLAAETAFGHDFQYIYLCEYEVELPRRQTPTQEEWRQVDHDRRHCLAGET